MAFLDYLNLLVKHHQIYSKDHHMEGHLYEIKTKSYLNPTVDNLQQCFFKNRFLLNNLALLMISFRAIFLGIICLLPGGFKQYVLNFLVYELSFCDALLNGVNNFMINCCQQLFY